MTEAMERNEQGFVVGQGVADAMASAGDEARSDEIYVVNEPEGQRISLTYGRLALYYWMEADGKVNRVPFG